MLCKCLEIGPFKQKDWPATPEPGNWYLEWHAGVDVFYPTWPVRSRSARGRLYHHSRPVPEAALMFPIREWGGVM